MAENSTSFGAAPLLPAIGLVLGGMAVIGFIDNFVVWVAETASLWQFHFVRAVLSAPALLVAIFLGWAAWPKRPGAVLLRSLFLTGAMFVYFGSLGIMSIGQALAGLFTAPIFVLIFGALFFGQSFRALQLLVAIAGLVGVLMVLQPEGDLLSLRLILPLSAGLLYGIAGLFTRFYCAEENTLTLLTIYTVFMGLGGALGVWWFWGANAPEGAAGYLSRGWGSTPPLFWLTTSVQAAGALIAVWCLTRAYQIAPPRVVSITEYALMIFGPAFAVLLFGDIPNALAIAGFATIICSGVAMTLLEREGR